MVEEEKKESGCMKKVAFGCLIMIVLGIGAGVYVYINAGRWARAAAAVGLEQFGDALLQGVGIPEDEKQAAMKPLQAFGEKIRAEEVSLQQGIKVMEQIAKGPVGVVVMTKGFEASYLKPSDIPDEEKAQGRRSVSRFVEGLTSSQIDMKKGEEVADICTVKTKSGDQENRELKKSISKEELQRCLKIMKDAADEAGIEDKLFKVDLAAELQKAIDEGMKEGKALDDQASKKAGEKQIEE